MICHSTYCNHIFLYVLYFSLSPPDIEDVIGHTDTKIISDSKLAVLVRQMAIHANVSLSRCIRHEAFYHEAYEIIFMVLGQAPDSSSLKDHDSHSY